MKFRWKIFFIFTGLIAVVFCIFGVWLVSATFSASLERVIERGKSDNKMLQFAFDTALDSLGEEYLVLDDKVIKDIANSLTKSKEGSSDIRVYSNDTTRLFGSGQYPATQEFIWAIDKTGFGYTIVNHGNAYILKCMCRTSLSEQNFYLENIMDISYVYEERTALLHRYRLVTVGLFLVMGVLILILSEVLTREVVSLSRLTRKFSAGNYQARVEDYSQDEIGDLAQDFNAMADNLENRMEELRMTAKRQEDFTASFAHELKTPLTAIIGYADMLRSMQLDTQERMEAANYIYSQGKRLESLSLKLLELIVLRKQEFEFAKLSGPHLIEEAAHTVQASLQNKGIHLRILAEDGYLWGDFDLLLSLLTNLIDNARKASQEGGEITVLGHNSQKGYEWIVTDQGCGIPTEELSRITEAFYMVDKSRARKEGGAGLGMTLCGIIVQIHGATWQIESKEGKGTTIRICFPIGGQG